MPPQKGILKSTLRKGFNLPSGGLSLWRGMEVTPRDKTLLYALCVALRGNKRVRTLHFVLFFNTSRGIFSNIGNIYKQMAGSVAVCKRLKRARAREEGESRCLSACSQRTELARFQYDRKKSLF